MTTPFIPHATLTKFGYPQNLITDYEHWLVLLRPQQPTLGALVIVAQDDVRAFGALPVDAFAELQQVIRETERTLTACFAHDKINYLMLMMVDPQVHFHVLPRYAKPPRFQDREFPDAAWPKAPDLSIDLALEERNRHHLRDLLRQAWPQRAAAL